MMLCHWEMDRPMSPPQKKSKKKESQEHQPEKRLRRQSSDVSLDSHGFPSFSKTPDHEKKGTGAQRESQGEAERSSEW